MKTKWLVNRQARGVAVSGRLEVHWLDGPAGQRWLDDLRKQLEALGFTIDDDEPAEPAAD